MVYLDNAATSFPKPDTVYKRWHHAMTAFGANPGRSGHTFSRNTAEAVFNARQSCAALFGADPENTVFTLNCTAALNFVIKGLAVKGGHFVVSDMEHNAVMRPIFAIAAERGIEPDELCTMFSASDDHDETVCNAERAFRPNTVAMICTAASNVTGLRTPLKRLHTLCVRQGVPLVADAAQGAGTLPVTLDCADFICAAGHKGLYGPMGTGLMITSGEYALDTLIEGGTGSMSESVYQPDFMPDRFESGTINTAGVIALGAGAEYVKKTGTDKILAHELSLCERFCAGASRIRGVRLYNMITPDNRAKYAPVVSFNLSGLSSSEAAELLSARGFCLRGGLHCAPAAHKKLGTMETGTVRFSPSMFNTAKETDALLSAIRGVMSR